VIYKIQLTFSRNESRFVISSDVSASDLRRRIFLELENIDIERISIWLNIDEKKDMRLIVKFDNVSQLHYFMQS